MTSISVGTIGAGREPSFLALTKAWCVGMGCSVAVAAAWRGSWLLLDAWLLPSNPAASAGISFAIGGALFGAVLAAHERLYLWTADWGRGRWVADALFSYVGGWIAVFVWRGAWQAMDHALGVGAAPSERGADANVRLARSGVQTHALGVVLLLLAGMLRSLNASPTLVSLDTATPLFGALLVATPRQISPLARLRCAPDSLPHARWRQAVGLARHDDGEYHDRLD
jgi:hypothetical protein